MPNYVLNISFDTADLASIVSAKQKVTLVKQNNQGVNLAWVAFQPFERNTLEWNTEYALYCSNVELQSGVQISKLSDIMASPACQYIFKDAVFSTTHESADAFSPNTYYLRNEMDGYNSLTFGLAQGIFVNGRAIPNRPINAVMVPYMHNTSFTPYEIINVYLESNIRESMVITNVSSKPITIVFGGGVDSVGIKYNRTSGTFYMV